MNKLTAACMMFLSSMAMGAGFQLDVAGARATGLGGAVTAFIDDPSSIYFNPAGISGHKGFDVSLGDTLIIPMINFTPADGSASTSTPLSVLPPPNAFAVFGITDEVSIGVGFFSPFGASVNWPAATAKTDSWWQGQFKSKSSSLSIFDINPTIAYRPVKWLKLGLGFNAIRGTVQIERGLNFVDSPPGSVLLGGGTWGYGWNAGLQVEVVEKKFSFGAAYRSAADMAFTGRAHFSATPPEFAGLLKDQAITADVTLPAQANFGFVFLPVETLKLALDFHYTNWSSFTELAINFDDPVLTNPLSKKWMDQISVHVAAELDITKSVQVRLGLVYDPTPSPQSTLTADLPDSTRIKVAAGVGWKHRSGFSVDVGYQFVALLGAHSTAPGFEGDYGGTAQVIGINLGFRSPGGGRTPQAVEPAAEPAAAPQAAPAPVR